jgi:NADH-quinone oxidoreductase subunit A
MSPDMPVVAADLAEGADANQLAPATIGRLRELGVVDPQAPVLPAAQLGRVDAPGDMTRLAVQETARKLALTSFADIAVFFGVLLVGFAYVWRRGDLNWVRATSSHRGEVVERAPPLSARQTPRPVGSILSA